MVGLKDGDVEGEEEGKEVGLVEGEVEGHSSYTNTTKGLA